MQDINKYYIKVASFFAVLLLAIIGIVFLVKSGVVEDKPISTQSEEAVKIRYEDFLPSKIESAPPPLERDPLLVIVSEKTPLRSDFIPILSDVENNIKLDSRAAKKFKEMASEAEKENLHLYICSGYRSVERQERNFENKIDKYLNQGYGKIEATQMAATIILPPGTSEHNAGLAMDICSLEQDFEETKEFRWLSENAADYGFILRYPEDKQDVTKIIYEPWHWRYVGVETAKEMKASGQCFEEYLGVA